MIDAKAWNGVQSLLDEYVHIAADDSVVLLYTSDSYEPTAWVSAALELREIPVERVWMAPLRDDGFLERLTPALPDPEELKGKLVILGFERDTMSHMGALAAALAPYDERRRVVFRAISASPNLFSDTMSVTPEELTARNTALLERLMNASSVHITTRSGSDIDVTVDSRRHRWISNRGIARSGGTAILPAGEVATFPAAISGTFIADFAFNVNAITDRDARLDRHPVRVDIEDGRAVRHDCPDPATRAFLDDCFQTYCAYNVGELGLGTNTGVQHAIPLNSHINERRPGVHLGFGQHNQDPGVVGYQCEIHLDLIADGGVLWIDEDADPIDLEHVVPSTAAHPQSPRDEDIFSPELGDLEVDDCCGILTSEGFRLIEPPGEGAR